jgi:hypothetical protein
MAEPFAYDAVAYRTRAIPQAHPDGLYVDGLVDEASRQLVRLMDGTRDRAALADGLRGLVPADQLDAGLPRSLDFLARAGLLVG